MLFWWHILSVVHLFDQIRVHASGASGGRPLSDTSLQGGQHDDRHDKKKSHSVFGFLKKKKDKDSKDKEQKKVTQV